MLFFAAAALALASSCARAWLSPAGHWSSLACAPRSFLLEGDQSGPLAVSATQSGAWGLRAACLGDVASGGWVRKEVTEWGFVEEMELTGDLLNVVRRMGIC